MLFRRHVTNPTTARPAAVPSQPPRDEVRNSNPRAESIHPPRRSFPTVVFSCKSQAQAIIKSTLRETLGENWAKANDRQCLAATPRRSNQPLLIPSPGCQPGQQHDDRFHNQQRLTNNSRSHPCRTSSALVRNINIEMPISQTSAAERRGSMEKALARIKIASSAHRGVCTASGWDCPRKTK